MRINIMLYPLKFLLVITIKNQQQKKYFENQIKKYITNILSHLFSDQ